MNLKVKGLNTRVYKPKMNNYLASQNIKKKNWFWKHSGTWKNSLNSFNILFQCCKPPIKKEKAERRNLLKDLGRRILVHCLFILK